MTDNPNQRENQTMLQEHIERTTDAANQVLRAAVEYARGHAANSYADDGPLLAAVREYETASTDLVRAALHKSAAERAPAAGLASPAPSLLPSTEMQLCTCCGAKAASPNVVAGAPVLLCRECYGVQVQP